MENRTQEMGHYHDKENVLFLGATWFGTNDDAGTLPGHVPWTRKT